VPLVPALEVRDVSKTFGHVRALDGASLIAHKHEIMAIVGDNGAGKSTLMKVITGIHQPDSGTISVDGAYKTFQSPGDARAVGIAAVFQDLALVECLDVATNMFLGQLPRRRWFVDRAAMERESRRVLDDLGATVGSVRTPIGMLSGGQRQMVAMARAIRSGARVILLDEPTAALGVRETAKATELIAGLRDAGCAVVLISHDLDLVFAISDRLEVMRLGRVVGVRTTADTTRQEVVGLITGAISGVADPDGTWTNRSGPDD
jgi:ABC-type sugar transport system ATPase subunit